jgi:tetratricopeptide (TPR) repeat protein
LRVALAALALAVATLAVYLPVRGHEFVDYDDLQVIVWNENLRPASLREAFALAFGTTLNANWIPLTTLSLQLDRALWSERPAGTLLGNVALHAAAAVAFFLALARLTGAAGRSAFAAGVFALHPLHVESVAWASARKDPLSGLFFALGLLAYARWVERPRAGRYAALAACFALALLAKPVAVTFPCVLLLLDAWPLGRLAAPAARRRALLEKVPLLALAAAASAATLLVQRDAGAMRQGAQIPLATRVLNAFDACGAYLADAFWPSGLAVFYPHPMGALPVGRALASCAALAALSAWALARWRRAPWLAVGWLWFLGTLVPVLGLVQVGAQARADRYTYLPLVGLAIAVAWEAVDRFGGTRAGRRALALLGLASLAALGAAARVQVGHWRDAVALHARAVEVTEGNFMEHHRLARALAERERLVEAEYHFRRSAELEPRRADPSVGLGDVLLRQGRPDDAVRAYREALAREPGHARAQANLGLALVRAGRADEALEPLRRAVAAGPDDANAQLGLARAYAALGRPRAALRHYGEALRLRPRWPAAASGRAWILATSADAGVRDPVAAIRVAEAARAQGPATPELLDALAAAYAAAGRFDDAVRTASEARALAASRDPALAAELRARLELYRARRAYVSPPDG